MKMAIKDAKIICWYSTQCDLDVAYGLKLASWIPQLHWLRVSGRIVNLQWIVSHFSSEYSSRIW